MTWNPATARHEMELPESQYLEIAKDICILARVIGCAVFVSGVREQRAHEVVEFETGYNLAMDGQELPDTASPAAKLGWMTVKGSDALLAEAAALIPPKVGVLDQITSETLSQEQIGDLHSINATAKLYDVPNAQSNAPIVETVAERANRVLAEPETLAELVKLKHATLKKMARDINLDMTGLNSNALLAAALVKAQVNQPAGV